MQALSRRLALVALTGAACLPPARGRDRVDGEPGRGLRLRGTTRYRVLGLSIYDATLWAADPFDPDEFAAVPIRLELTYHRDFRSQAVVDRSLAEMARGGPLPADRLAGWRDFLSAAVPDIRAGERLAASWFPDRRTTRLDRPGFGAVVAGQELVDRDFGPRFLGIWLASTTSEPEMRRRLLGLA